VSSILTLQLIYKYKIMGKECKTARNMVASAMVILAILIVVMSMSSCATSGNCGGWGGWSASTNCPAYR
jgi:hypothetical protein